MFNKREFLAYMARKGVTRAQVAEHLGISTKTLFNKMKRGVFGSDEILVLIDYLSIEDPMKIFFNH